MKVKVLQFITGLNPGGAEMMMYKTIEQLNHKKYEIVICSLVGGSLEKEISKKYKVIVLNAQSVFSLPAAILKLRKIIKKEKIDIIHSYLYHANIVSRIAAMGTKAKVISSIRIKEIKKKSHNIIDALTSGLVDKYTVVARNVREFIIKKEGISPERIITIPNGLDFKKYEVKVDKKKKLKELGLKKDSKILISVANLRKTKDYPTLFKAVKLVLNHYPVELLVVGKGEAEEEYKKIAEQLGIMKHVHFLGFRKDEVKIELVKISDICILSTFYEGQSNSLLEYMAMEKPIVATAIEENIEVIDDGKEGLLTKPKSPELMEKAIIKLLEDKMLREKLARNAYNRVKKYHDIKRVAKQTEKLYEELCAE
ncbi:MAG TPA: glycosyltransferase [Candidatus Nanoarchaeia archaeon]|nr:glycosyltransferase [Candidatus Nanoarchaeia archaeon]